MIKITLGSLELVKLGACDMAIKTLRVQAMLDGMKVESGQDEQPIGLSTTRAGAFARAQAVILRHPNRIAIGIESGIVIDDEEAFDVAFVEILRKGRPRITTTTSLFPLPIQFVRAAQAHGFALATVGEMVARTMGGNAHDPHAVLSGGKVTRTKLIALAIMQGLERAL